jgi:two-component system cell cycle response regulator
MEPEPEFVENKTSLVSTADLVRDVGVAVPRDIPTLILMEGASAGATHKIELPKTILGRSESAQFRIIDGNISRHHAQVLSEDGRMLIEDLGSTNGTRVNGTLISGRHELADGDKITLGPRTILKFTLQDTVEEKFQQQIYDQASRDALTGAFNRKTFEEHLRAACASSTRVALVLFDADHFKKVNDTHGHPAGDQVLAEIARRASGVLRHGDFLCRYGGEEFAVLCRSAGLPQAAMIGERLRQAVVASPFAVEALSLNVTVSVGVSAYPTPEIHTAQQLVGAADAALYCAKSRGRNQVVIHRPDLVSADALTDPAAFK